MTATGLRAAAAEVVGKAHPELDRQACYRMGDQLLRTALTYGGLVEDLVAESVRAENSSAAGNDTNP